MKVKGKIDITIQKLENVEISIIGIPAGSESKGNQTLKVDDKTMFASLSLEGEVYVVVLPKKNADTTNFEFDY